MVLHFCMELKLIVYRKTHLETRNLAPSQSGLSVYTYIITVITSYCVRTVAVMHDVHTSVENCLPHSLYHANTMLSKHAEIRSSRLRRDCLDSHSIILVKTTQRHTL